MWQLRSQLGVTGAMREMCEPRLSRADFFRGTHSLRHTEVRRVGRAEERVQHEDIDSTKSSHGILRQLFRVRDVAKIADTVSVNGGGAVWK